MTWGESSHSFSLGRTVDVQTPLGNERSETGGLRRRQEKRDSTTPKRVGYQGRCWEGGTYVSVCMCVYTSKDTTEVILTDPSLNETSQSNRPYRDEKKLQSFRL